MTHALHLHPSAAKRGAGRGPPGGMAQAVYGLVQKSGKIALLTKAGLHRRTHSNKIN